MRPRLIPLLIVVSVLLTCASGAAAAWLAVDGAGPAAPTVKVTDLGPGRTLVEVMLAGVEADTVLIDGRRHVRILLPGHVQLLERGAPQLPFVTTSLIVPDTGTPRVRVVETEYRDFAVARPEPSKGSIPRPVDPRTVPYEFGPAYAGGVFPAEAAGLSRPYVIRDHRGVNLRLYPVRWDADRGLLRVLARAVFEVATSGDGGVNPGPARTSPTPPAFAELYAKQFANADPARKSGLDDARGGMLIVCHDPFVAAMQPFVTWKTERGIPVELITTSSVGGSVAGIQAAIAARYAAPEGLTYVILVGDGAEVPYYVRDADGANDDTRYVRLAGDDVYPDALISRLSAQTPDQVATQVARIIAYERDTAAPADWTHRGVGIASDEDGGSGVDDHERMDQLRDRLLTFDFTDVDRVYQNLGGTTEDIAAAVNDGRSLIDYMGHGSGQSWGSVYFGNGDVHALTNDAWPWIIDVSCFNGGFSSHDECLAEAWLRAGSASKPYGAVGVYAASGSIPWVEPTVMQHEAVRLLCNSSSKVLGVLVHAGIMEVLDQYGEEGVGLLLVEHYNLLGDCSLVVRTSNPDAVAVTHQPVVPLFAPAITVETDAPGARVTLSGDGVIHGSALANSLGRAEVVLTDPVDTVGEVTLTVFGVNRQTYRAMLPTAHLATVSLDPTSLPVGATTTVSVTVVDPDGGAGLADVLVSVEGFGGVAGPLATDATGQVSLDVTPAYGEVLQVRGRATGTAYDLFVVALPVTGAPSLADPAVSAAVPDIGLDGALTPGRAGEVTASITGDDFTLYLRGDGLDTSQATVGDSLTVAVVPVELSPVTATIARLGHEIFQQEIAVIAALGTLAGVVADTAAGGTPLAAAVVEGWPQGADVDGPPLFAATTDASGSFAAPDPLPVGDYDLRITRFGYAPQQETIFLPFGASDFQFGLAVADTGEISGTVIAAIDGAPLAATVSVRRADTDELYVAVATDPETGAYATGPLPYFDYRVVAESFGQSPAAALLTVDAPALAADFTLVPALGELLVLDDGDPGDLVADLDSFGYNLTVEAAGLSDLATWAAYDLVIYAAGASDEPLADAALRTNLLAHEQAGGRLLIEGGEVASVALDDPGHPGLATDVLHAAAWHGDAGGDVTVAVANHPVMLVPNIIVGPLDITFYDWAVADRATATTDAVPAGAWTSYPEHASVICHDDDPEAVGGQTVFFLFAYEAAGEGRRALLENALVWLRGAEPEPTPAAGASLPARLSLAGNHPNPFNPRTVISFALPVAGEVDLAVFDLRGRRVRTLVRGPLPAGRHEVAWQGQDDGGRSLASGVYVTRLAAAGELRILKMTLLK